jgi:hypothetical protein
MGEKSPSQELLLADLEHFGESIWKNEEIGEKRFNFFVTLITAVAGGLVALWSNDKLSENVGDLLPGLTRYACLALLIFGLGTYFRMLHRDRVTEGFKRTTRYIRDTYRVTLREECQLAMYAVPLEPPMWAKKKADLKPKYLLRLMHAGYTPTLGVMNGVLLFAFLVWSTARTVAFAYGIGLAAVLWIVGSWPYEKPGT